MIASLSRRVVFLHLPKNAGTAVRHALREAFMPDCSLVEGWGVEDGKDLAHPLPSTLKERFPEVYQILGEEDAASIAILRDPIQRCVAAFREHRLQFGQHPAACATLGRYLDRIEEGFYRTDREHSAVFIHGAPQREFLFENDRPLIRKFLRLDDPLFYPKLCLAVGVLLPPLELVNASREVPAYARRDDVRRILRIYHADYDLLESIPAETSPATSRDSHKPG